MSIDRSLRIGDSLVRHRNVLTRAERLERLLERGVWNESKGALGLPKVSHRRVKTASKKKEKAGEEEAT